MADLEIEAIDFCWMASNTEEAQDVLPTYGTVDFGPLRVELRDTGSGFRDLL